MADNLESVLAELPFIGGQLAQRQYNQRQNAGQLGQAVTLMSIIQHAQSMKDAETLKQVMAQPGTPEQKIQALLASGPRGAEMAQHYATALKGMEDVKIRQQLSGGSLDLKNPDVLDRLSGLPGMGHFAPMAERVRQQSAAEQSFNLMRGTQLPEAQTGPSQAGTLGFAPTEADAQKQVLEAAQTGNTATIQVEPNAQAGGFANLINSPIPQVAAQARMLQNRMNQTPPTPQSLKFFQDAQKSLDAQEARFMEFRNAAKDRLSNRPQEPLVSVLGPDGKPVLVPRAEAVGATPATPVTIPPAETINPENATLHGEDYIKTLPQGTQNVVRGLITYQLPLNSLSTRKTGNQPSERQMAFEHAHQADPNFNVAKYDTRRKVMMDFTSGPTANNITALDQALNHMATLNGLATALENHDTQAVNQIVNAVKRQFGSSKVTNYETAQTAVGTELMRVFRQVNASEQETKDWISKFPLKGSPAQMHESLSIGAKLLDGRINAINNRWNNGMDTEGGYPKIMSPQAKAALGQLLAATAAQPQTQTGPFDDPGKERRYQEWKARQGQ